MADTLFGGVIEFITRLGFYDVILPFLLVFTLVYGILDKTRVLGVEGKDNAPKRGLNSTIAFVMGLLVVFTKPLVMAINEYLANVVVLMIIAVFFMVAIGVFVKQGELSLYETNKPLFWTLVGIIGFAMVLLILHALRTGEGKTWLDVVWDYFLSAWTDQAAASVLFVIGVVLFMWFITRGEKPKPGSSGRSSGSSSG